MADYRNWSLRVKMNLNLWMFFFSLPFVLLSGTLFSEDHLNLKQVREETSPNRRNIDEAVDTRPLVMVPKVPVETSKDLFSIVSEPAQHQVLKRLKELLLKGDDPNQLNDSGELLLNRAILNAGKEQMRPSSEIRSGRYDNVLLLLEAGADIKRSGSSGTPLHMAARQGDVNLTYLFLEKGANVNSRDSHGNTPLMAAIPWSEEVFNILLNRGADIQAKNKRNQSAIDLAGASGKFEFMELLHRYGASLDTVVSRMKYDLSRNPNQEKERMLKKVEELAQSGSRLSPPPLFPRQLLPSVTEPPIIVATRKNDMEEIKRLLKEGADVNAISVEFNGQVHDFKEALTYGATALHISLFKKFDDLAELLIESGAKVNLRAAANDYDDNNVPLSLASRDEKMTRILLDHGAKVDLPSVRFRNTSLMEAKQEDVMKLLLERGANINHQAKYSTVLMDAVEKKDAAKVAFLLQHGASVDDSSDHDGSTALHKAVSQQSTDIVSLLLKKGANPEVKNFSGLNPYELARSGKNQNIVALFTGSAVPKMDSRRLMQEAIQKGDHDLVKTLLSEGAEPNGDQKWPFLIQAVHSGRDFDETIKLLIEYGANVNVIGESGGGLLHFINNPDLISLAVQKGANVNTPNNRGATPLHIAAGKGQIKRVERLLELGGDAKAQAENGFNPLHYAAFGPPDHRPGDGPPPDWSKISDYVLTIKALIKAGASHKVKNQNGKTPLDIASQRKEPEMEPIRHLLKSFP